jgi:ABC-type transporter Mla maintaining outer membrane lipid asymmetry permease subunit MlaE
MTGMQDNQSSAWSAQKSIVIAAIIALAMLYGGYQVGKDLALRDSAQCEGQ